MACKELFNEACKLAGATECMLKVTQQTVKSNMVAIPEGKSTWMVQVDQLAGDGQDKHYAPKEG